MPIHYEHSLEVSRPPEDAFSLLDDVSQTPKWLERCTGIEKLTPGANAVGTKLRYSYKDGGRRGTMDGEITARQPNERLTMRYSDTMMDVVVDFRVAKADRGARLTHAIDITPKTFMAKLVLPLIRRSLPKQIVRAMEMLRGLLETKTVETPQ
jgi:carbon monoxide dehydrogenase subunit G